MLGVALILGAGLIAGASILAKYWNNVLEFLKKVINKLQIKIPSDHKLMGAAVFIQKIGNKFQNRTKHYSKSELGKWKETIVTYEQNVEEIPEEYVRRAASGEECDLTSELELQLNEA